MGWREGKKNKKTEKYTCEDLSRSTFAEKKQTLTERERKRARKTNKKKLFNFYYTKSRENESFVKVMMKKGNFM